MPVFGKGRRDALPLEMTPSTAASSVSSLPPSPFFAPSSRPRTVLKKISTPGGTKRLRRHEDVSESKSSLTGASFNLINTIVGAGIVGIPFAVKEAGFVAGVALVVLCAALTVKSLRLLIETAKHIDVPSYETLCEASFGKAGFLFISAAMFVNSFGAMVSYLMIVKSTLPFLLGVSPDDEATKRAVLTVSSFVVMLPLCMQRDMAALTKTSVISVCFDCIMVGIVAAVSPWRENIEDGGGFVELASTSTLRPSTFFIGLGVLSFAFVCQHGAFIIAGSLERPTKERWGKVSLYALTTCGILATTCGALGYLGYLEQTDGNILNNLGHSMPGRVARSLMCCAMFFVYPMECFVARHVAVVVLFQGRKAHEGDDHAVLARTDRRVALTLSLYLISLVPALLFDDLGNVLAVSGSVGGSSLSYLGPGACYLAIHGDSFLDMVRKSAGWGRKLAKEGGTKPTPPAPPPPPQASDAGETPDAAPRGGLLRLYDDLVWYILLMPVWCGIASIGQKMLDVHEEEEALKSPHIGRLGKVIHHKPVHGIPAGRRVPDRAGGASPRSPYGVPRRTPSDGDEEGGEAEPLLVRHNSFPAKGPGGTASLGTLDPSQYGSHGGKASAGGGARPVGNRGIAAAIAASKKARGGSADGDQEAEEDPQEEPPNAWDFAIAIAYIVFGVVAMTAGLGSIFMASNGDDAPIGGRRLLMKY